MLNRVWLALFGAAFLAMLWQLFSGQTQVVNAMVDSLFAMAKLSVDIALGLIGVMALWLGLMKVAERAGLIQQLSRLLNPVFRRLMPEVPAGHPAQGSVTMNLVANALGLDNAATPLGIKAMEDLHSLNRHKDRASNAQILFLVLNTSSVTLLPVVIFLYRAQQGAAQPAEVFLPILLATSASTLAGLLAVALVQRIRLWDGALLLALGVLMGLVAALAWWTLGVSAELMNLRLSLLGNGAILAILGCFLAVAAWRKVAVYEVFVDGAREGFTTAVRIIPYLLAMLAAIGLLRASGALDLLVGAIGQLVAWLGLDARFVDALPTGLMKPFSGSASRALMLETMNHHGVDSFAGRLSAVMQGSTETTFYVLAVYFGAVGIKHSRHAVPCALAADLAGIGAAIAVCYLYFG
ncbi:nucleoside recognition domain-containing protein [Gallaecimonas sp. GXIMD4217]|uniref:nucleoside recognition domain-containing protein n=1 Tax=Gallaecimonas sp. GXIMD4217 TaxID=3131927 RepID=UPI00311AFC65